MNDKVHRFGNAHEITGHIRMGNGYGAAAINLLVEGWDDAPPAAQDIAKTNGCKQGCVINLRVERVQKGFANTLAGSHYADWINGLIGRDKYKTLNMIFLRQACYTPCSTNVDP